jgi:CubicO group peptidase (beta-lactamase class C family)
MSRALRVPVLALAAALALQHGTGAQPLAFNLFELYVEPLRQQAGIPGLSAAILQDGHIVWSRGFGLRDLEASLPARPDTPYPVADLTQTFSAVMLLKCVEFGLVRLDDPISTWVPGAADATMTLSQLLMHATPPGSATGYRYDPGRFAALAAPIEACGHQPYRKLLAHHVLEPLGMQDAVPGQDILTAPADVRERFDATAIERYRDNLARMATAYRVDKRGRPSRVEGPAAGINAATGLIASVGDLARYDRGLTDLLLPETLAESWTNGVAHNTPLPTGLGWFVQAYQGEAIVWHFGLAPDAYSSLILKVPRRGLTLIMLANSDGLSAPYALDKGDVTSSLFAKTFLRLFL